jgi:succinate-semialdehyde dehydrogenase/glutarate-semialdehyde dehydrogenase
MTAPMRTEAFVAGQWRAGDTRFPVRNPATGEVVAECADLGAADAEAAIAAAQAAFPGWASMLAKDRAAILKRWFALIMANQDRIAAIMTAEGGKPLAEAKGEVAYGASFVEWYAEEAKRAYGRTIPTTHAGRRYLVTKQPVGVVAAVTPWNFPMAMITRKAAPALAAGCTVVLKPAEATPLTALALAELAAEAGLPPGCLNIVTTSAPGPVGEVLTKSPIVKKFTFTGSTAVGKLLAAQCAGTVKKVSLELGGNAPFIVFADADLDKAVAGVMAAKWRNSGQVCTTPNRVLVHSSVHDAFAAKLTQAVRVLKVGPGDQDGVQVGPLIDARGLAKVERLVSEAIAAGAAALTGGKRHTAGAQFYAPTVLTGVTPRMSVSREEIFGPVLPLITFETDDEAIRLANDTPYGLAAYFFTSDISRAFRVSEGLEYGMVSVNEGLMSQEVAPFGGMKESGVGREGGLEGLEEFLEVKFTSFGNV